jgi:hypothetical protein
MLVFDAFDLKLATNKILALVQCEQQEGFSGSTVEKDYYHHCNDLC